MDFAVADLSIFITKLAHRNSAWLFIILKKIAELNSNIRELELEG